MGSSALTSREPKKAFCHPSTSWHLITWRLSYFPAQFTAGEGSGIESIKDAVVSGRALRIGHGVRLVEDIMFSRTDGDTDLVVLGPVAQWVHDRQIALEVSPSSNLQTGAFSLLGDTMADHPIDIMYDLGFNVTVNTDNRLMSSTNLTKELQILVDTFGYKLGRP